jgi:hypothetical protein
LRKSNSSWLTPAALAQKQELNKTKSEETKLKISLALKNHPSLKFSYKKYKPIIMSDINGNTIKTFPGVGVTLKELNLSQNNFKDIIVNKKLYLPLCSCKGKPALAQKQEQKYYLKYK